MLPEILTSLGIIATIAAAVTLAALAGLHRRRTRRTYTQVTTIPAFTDSMPGHRQRVVEQERIATLASDARLILHRQYAGRAATRRAMNRLGMSDRRWQAATRLLRGLGIYKPNGFLPTISEYHAQRRIDKWQRIQTARVGASPTFVASH